MWAPKCALSLFFGIQVALGQALVPEPVVKRVNPDEGSTKSAVNNTFKLLVLGTTQLGHLGALTLHETGRAVGENGVISSFQHRQLQSMVAMLALKKKDSEVCIVALLRVEAYLPTSSDRLRRLQGASTGMQVKILLTFTHADGTTGSGTTIVDVQGTGSLLFYFELSADEANNAGTGICDGCSFIVEDVDCVTNCDGYSFVGTSRELRYSTPDIADTPACPCGEDMCDDPHMQGLMGQHIDWSGVDGNWYNLVADDNADLHVNLRLTAPLPVEFPNRQLITGLSILSDGHSLVIEVTDPYSTATDGCPHDVLPCLADGGLVISVDGHEVIGLLGPTRDEVVADGVMTLSASNLPVECRQFGGDKIWARMYDEMTQGQRELKTGTFEDWVMQFSAAMAAPGWCAKYIAAHGLGHVKSNHALFKIDTPTVTIRLHVGVNHQGDGELDWDGSILPDLDFWQMDVGLDGLCAMNPSLSGVLGETARPVVDGEGRNVMEGPGAMRGTVEDYRVSDALGTDFNMLHM